MASEILRRRVSGKGLLIIPEENRKWKQLWLTVVEVRPPQNQYKNFEWNAEESLYGRVQWTGKNGIMQTYLCKYPLQTWEIWNNQAGQNLLAQKCVYDGILDTFVNLGNALNLLPIIRENDIENWKIQLCPVESILWNSYSTGAVELILTGENYEFCNAADVQAYDLFEVPVPERVENDVPIIPAACNDGSPTYPCDGGFTNPNSLDFEPIEPPVGFPIGVIGETWRVTGQIREVNGVTYFGGSDRTTQTRDLLAPIQFYGFWQDSGLATGGEENQIGFSAVGLAGETPPSGAQQWISTGNLVPGFEFEFTIVSTEKL